MFRVHRNTTRYGRKLSYGANSRLNRRPCAHFRGRCHGLLVYPDGLHNMHTVLLCTVDKQTNTKTHRNYSDMAELTKRTYTELCHEYLSTASKPTASYPTLSLAVENELNMTECTQTNMIKDRDVSDSRHGAFHNCDNILLMLPMIKNSNATSMLHTRVGTRGACTSGSSILRRLRLYMSGNGVPKRCYSARPSSSRSVTHYYDVLGLTPKASRKDIKSAYYSLSKLYHPDLKTDSASEVKFSEISEAYEVLGNKTRKRLYDRGLLNPLNPNSGNTAADVNDNIDEDFLRGRQHQQFKKRGPIQTGRSKVYNFDEFYQQHYGTSFKKNQEQKKSKESLDELYTGFANRHKWGLFGTALVIGVTVLRMIFRH